MLFRSSYLPQKYQEYLSALEKAINPVFCVLPGLFNGFCGLEVAKYIYNDRDNRRVYNILCKRKKGINPVIVELD